MNIESTNETGDVGAKPNAPGEVLENGNTLMAADLTPGFDVLGRFEVSPLRLAERILERKEWARRCLLVTDDSGKFVTLKTLDPATGIWRDPEAMILGWLGEIADILESEAYVLAAKHRMDPKTVSGMVRAIRSIKTPKQVDNVCRSFAAALGRVRASGLEPLIRQCRPADMDADLRYFGVLNGVVDSHTALLLTAEEAAPALVTIFARVPYDPDRYPAADWFLSHLSPTEREWWLDILGFALRGIAKRLYGCLAPPDAGKTSAINLLRATLGPYVASPTVGALDAKVRHDASGHTPGMFAWLAPVRITIVDEVKERELSAPLVKDLTGGGWFTARDTYERKVTKRATGTTFMFANDVAGEQPLPQLRTDDPGMKARYRELPFPVIPTEQQDPAMRDEWPYDVERQAQLLTLLVQRAAMNPTEPTDTPQVRDATAARILKDSGDLGLFGRRFVQDGSAMVEFPKAWTEWCETNGEGVDTVAPGGIRKRDFTRRLSAHVEGLGETTVLRTNGKKARGWRGWKLLTVEEAERSAVKVAEQVVRDLYDMFPELAEGKKRVRMFDDYEEEALNHRYSIGWEFEKEIKKTTLLAGKAEVDGEQKDLYTDMPPKQRTALLRYQAMEVLTTGACLMYPMGPVCEKARERMNRLPTVTYGRENVALVFLRIAEWELGRDDSPRHAETVVERAIKLKDAELRRDPSKKDYYAPDVEAAMKELVGLQAAQAV